MTLKRFGLIGSLAAVAVLVLALVKIDWFSPKPVEIRLNRIITRPQVVTTGMGDALILAPDGTVWGWGDNSTGILGIPAAKNRGPEPRLLNVGSNWTTLAVTVAEAYAIKRDGTLWGWTHNPSAGANGMPALTFPPAPVLAGSNWVSLVAGLGHCLALRSDGALFAWGQNGHGQVGDGTTSNVKSPVQVGTSLNWVGIAAGAFGSMGLQSDGSLWHWGFVEAGYGKGPDLKFLRPTRVGTSTNWTKVVAGDYVYAANDSDDSIWVWGPNSQMLGVTNQSMPQRLDLGSQLEVVSAGSFFAVWRKSDGTLCILDEKSGRPISADKAKEYAHLYGGRDGWVQAWAGTEINFGLFEDGTLMTWGLELGTQRNRRFRDVLNKLLVRIGLRRPVNTMPQPKIAKEPWPIARFVTNNVPTLTTTNP